ncbi:MAG: GatB/YqeY domain-containing protein [Oligoflexia bacterium]|nr:GatB/YqeY domain-containing protein [Oligoflexia bacterium]MBF0367045.1 GatB/YqeY domain-containing protein [Oligoflexia bacterium]
MSLSSLLEQVSQDIKEAMKNQEKERLSALRMLKSALIENKTAAAPRAEIEVVVSYSKKIRDSLESYPEADLMREKLTREIAYIKVYMPQEMSEQEVRILINEIMTTVGAKNAGMVMKELSPKIKGRFDGKRANALVQELLEKS